MATTGKSNAPPAGGSTVGYLTNLEELAEVERLLGSRCKRRRLEETGSVESEDVEQKKAARYSSIKEALGIMVPLFCETDPARHATIGCSAKAARLASLTKASPHVQPSGGGPSAAAPAIRTSPASSLVSGGGANVYAQQQKQQTAASPHLRLQQQQVLSAASAHQNHQAAASAASSVSGRPGGAGGAILSPPLGAATGSRLLAAVGAISPTALRLRQQQQQNQQQQQQDLLSPHQHEPQQPLQQSQQAQHPHPPQRLHSENLSPPPSTSPVTLHSSSLTNPSTAAAVAPQRPPVAALHSATPSPRQDPILPQVSAHHRQHPYNQPPTLAGRLSLAGPQQPLAVHRQHSDGRGLRSTHNITSTVHLQPLVPPRSHHSQPLPLDSATLPRTSSQSSSSFSSQAAYAPTETPSTAARPMATPFGNFQPLRQQQSAGSSALQQQLRPPFDLPIAARPHVLASRMAMLESSQPTAQGGATYVQLNGRTDPAALQKGSTHFQQHHNEQQHDMLDTHHIHARQHRNAAVVRQQGGGNSMAAVRGMAPRPVEAPAHHQQSEWDHRNRVQ